MSPWQAGLLGVAWGLVGASSGVAIRKYSRSVELQDPEFDQRVTVVDRWLPVALCAALFAAFAVRLATLAIPLSERVWLLAIESVYLVLFVQIFAFDLKHRIILDWVVGAGALAAFALAFVTPHFGEPTIFSWSSRWLSALLGAIIGGALFSVIYLVGRGRALGAADPKLAAFIGMVCGISLNPIAFRTVQALFYGIIIGGLVGVGVVLSRRRTLREYIPYGPWLVLGAWVVLFLKPLLVE
jgi:leader peptidase (prepilin peptidase)/N-methyltransferase